MRDGHSQVFQHNPDIQGLTETDVLPSQRSQRQRQRAYHLMDGRAQGSPY